MLALSASFEFIKSLLEVKNDSGCTPLHLVAERNATVFKELIFELLNHEEASFESIKSLLEVEDNRGNTPLNQIAFSDATVFKELIFASLNIALNTYNFHGLNRAPDEYCHWIIKQKTNLCEEISGLNSVEISSESKISLTVLKNILFLYNHVVRNKGPSSDLFKIQNSSIIAEFKQLIRDNEQTNCQEIYWESVKPIIERHGKTEKPSGTNYVVGALFTAFEYAKKVLVQENLKGAEALSSKTQESDGSWFSFNTTL